jgi:hypothetical protein
MIGRNRNSASYPAAQNLRDLTGRKHVVFAGRSSAALWATLKSKEIQGKWAKRRRKQTAKGADPLGEEVINLPIDQSVDEESIQKTVEIFQGVFAGSASCVDEKMVFRNLNSEGVA